MFKQDISRAKFNNFLEKCDITLCYKDKEKTKLDLIDFYTTCSEYNAEHGYMYVDCNANLTGGHVYLEPDLMIDFNVKDGLLVQNVNVSVEPEEVPNGLVRTNDEKLALLRGLSNFKTNCGRVLSVGCVIENMDNVDFHKHNDIVSLLHNDVTYTGY